VYRFFLVLLLFFYYGGEFLVKIAETGVSPLKWWMMHFLIIIELVVVSLRCLSGWAHFCMLIQEVLPTWVNQASLACVGSLELVIFGVFCVDTAWVWMLSQFGISLHWKAYFGWYQNFWCLPSWNLVQLMISRWSQYGSQSCQGRGSLQLCTLLCFLGWMLFVPLKILLHGRDSVQVAR